MDFLVTQAQLVSRVLRAPTVRRLFGVAHGPRVPPTLFAMRLTEMDHRLSRYKPVLVLIRKRIRRIPIGIIWPSRDNWVLRAQEVLKARWVQEGCRVFRGFLVQEVPRVPSV